MTPKLFLSEEDTNDNDYFYEIPGHVTHIDDNAIERLKKILQERLLRDDDAVFDPNSFQYNKPGAFESLMKDSSGMPFFFIA